MWWNSMRRDDEDMRAEALAREAAPTHEDDEPDRSRPVPWEWPEPARLLAS